MEGIHNVVKKKQITNDYDFGEHTENKWIATSDKRFFCVKHSEGYHKYEMENMNDRQIEHNLISSNSDPETQCHGI